MDPDTDLGTPINPDPDPQHWSYECKFLKSDRLFPPRVEPPPPPQHRPWNGPPGLGAETTTLNNLDRVVDPHPHPH